MIVGGVGGLEPGVTLSHNFTERYFQNHNLFAQAHLLSCKHKLITMQCVYNGK